LLLHIPLRSTLRRPGPVEPAATLLISIELSLNEAANVGTILVRKAGDSAHGFAGAGTNGTIAASKGTIVAGTDALAIQVLSTISHGTGPLANNRPLVGVEDVVANEAASSADVGGGIHAKHAVVEDFVVVSVHHHVPDTARFAHESVPRFSWHETVVKNNGGVLAGLTDDTPGVVVVLLQAILVHSTGNAGLIQGLNSGNDIGITAVAGGQSLESSAGEINIVARLPLNSTTLTAVVEAILGAGGYSSSVRFALMKTMVGVFQFTYHRAGQQ